MCVRCSQDESHGIFNKLHTHFSAKGYEVFNPSAAFKKTRPSKQAMADAVASSQLVIAALSKEFFKSKWCQAEIVAAQKAGITVQPVYAGDFVSNQQMEGWVYGGIRAVVDMHVLSCHEPNRHTQSFCHVPE